MKPLFRLQQLCRTALLCALLCVLSVITVPIGTVPVTLGLLGVFLCGLSLPPRNAAAAAWCYLFLGALGLPVFSSMQGGIGILFSLTGGFLWSYPLTAWVTAKGVQSALTSAAPQTPIYTVFVLRGCLIGLLLSYLSGCAWYLLSTGASVRFGFYTCVLPFLPFDVCKILAAISIVTHAKHRFSR